MGVLHVVYVILLTFSLLISNQSVTGSKVLLISVNIKSQMVMFGELALALAERGHDVTIAKGSTFKMPGNIKHPRITIETYHVSQVAMDDNTVLQDAIIQQVFNFSITSVFNLGRTMLSLVTDDTWSCFNDKDFKKRLAAIKFDFAVLSPPMAQPYVYTVYELGIPFAYMGIECMMSQMSLTSMSPSYVPNLMLGGWLTENMNILQKTVNTMAYMAYTIGIMTTSGAGRVHELIPDKPPISFIEIERTASLCLRVRESIISTPTPNLPNVIDIGTLVIRESETLPDNIQQFLDNSPDGVVYVSFGSIVDKLPDSMLAKMADAFQMTTYRIIWKRKKQPTIHLPEDKFLVLPWAPQTDILAHPNTKSFVSHCGYSSSLEAVYYGVPIIGIPFLADQRGNANLMEHKGYAKKLDAASFTAEELAAAIEEVISGPQLISVKKASAIFKDMPSGRDKAVFWIEHVIKHGAAHLQSRAQHMPLWEYLMLDVALVVVIAMAVLSCALRCCCGSLYRRCCKRKDVPKATKLD